MSSIGPCGATSGAQTYSPAFSLVTVSTTEPELISTCWAEADTGRSARARNATRPHFIHGASAGTREGIAAAAHRGCPEESPMGIARRRDSVRRRRLTVLRRAL